MALIEPQVCVQQATRKEDVARRFSDAAMCYDELAGIQAKIASAALARISKSGVAHALDIGCGTGHHTFVLSQCAKQTTGLDIAPGMLAQAGANYPALNFVKGDAEHLPWQDDEFDVIFSSMALQWCSSPVQVMRELMRVLCSGGTAELAIMVDGSFNELQHSGAQCGVKLRLNPLFSARDWLNAAKQAGLICHDQVLSNYRDSFNGLLELLRSIKYVGAGSSTNQTLSRGLSRKAFKRLEATMMSESEAKLFNTYKVLHFSLEKRL